MIERVGGQFETNWVQDFFSLRTSLIAAPKAKDIAILIYGFPAKKSDDANTGKICRLYNLGGWPKIFVQFMNIFSDEVEDD